MAGPGSPATGSRFGGPNDGNWITIRRRHGSEGDHLRAHHPRAGNLLPVPGGGDQQRGRQRLVGRGPGLHACRHSRGTDRADGPGGRHVADRPVVECAPKHRRRLDPRLPDRGVRATGAGTWNIIRRDTRSAATTFSEVDLEPATTRHYRVAAINIAGNGPFSNVDAGDHRGDSSGRAPRPHGGGGRHLGDRPLLAGAQRRWRRRRSPVTVIEVSEDGGCHLGQDLVANTRSTRTTYSHTGLAPATTRHYRVSAINRIGLGRASSVASATTDATVPDAPTGLVATRDHTHADRPRLGRARLRRRRPDQRLPHRGLGDRRRLDRSTAQHRVGEPHVLAPRTTSGKHALLPRLGDQPRGHRRAVGSRFSGDGRSRRTRGTAQHPRPAPRGRGDDIEHGLGDRPPRRRGGQRDGDGTARGGERTVLHGREAVLAGRRAASAARTAPACPPSSAAPRSRCRSAPPTHRKRHPRAPGWGAGARASTTTLANPARPSSTGAATW